ncbi:hypothetical protein CDD82_5028 [Ophiocordyceps australis]|uniref:Uncharacterized protein n=1 Tax=Ophiocordyceps australis TaxID=1399860 RepID=A0A2C5YXH8_9HYPO|nr:hypothetical protein CDD82_5028 [Ophiocordyceps australis]
MENLLVLLVALSAFVATATGHIQPDHESSKANAHRIFNAVHSATRQWGSSLIHNGFSFFPATMPRGTLTYHGSLDSHSPTGPEWLAFEVEHAQIFAQAWLLNVVQSPVRDQKLLTKSSSVQHDLQGYLHTYQANRDLNLLYVDGMSAGKSDLGTLDSQDLVLLAAHPHKTPNLSPIDEMFRAKHICELITSWGYDGFMRMEMGFEIIYCDFNNGLNLVGITPTANRASSGKAAYTTTPQWARAAAERYDGVGGDRIRLDFSSMVSGFFFPINVSSTDPHRPDLPRLGAAEASQLMDIKSHLHTVSLRDRAYNTNWQAIVDMIVSRFTARFNLMASPRTCLQDFVHEIFVSTGTYHGITPTRRAGQEDEEKGNRTAEAVELCTKHYLLPTHLDRQAWTLEDSLIHTAVETVTSDICNTLFLIRALMLDTDASLEDSVEHSHMIRSDVGLQGALQKGRQLLLDLRQRLSWPVFKKPPVCAVDEMILTPMWPIGDAEDFWHPDCQPLDKIVFNRGDYWREHDKI